MPNDAKRQEVENAQQAFVSPPEFAYAPIGHSRAESERRTKGLAICIVSGLMIGFWGVLLAPTLLSSARVSDFILTLVGTVVALGCASFARGLMAIFVEEKPPRDPMRSGVGILFGLGFAALYLFGDFIGALWNVPAEGDAGDWAIFFVPSLMVGGFAAIAIVLAAMRWRRYNKMQAVECLGSGVFVLTVLVFALLTFFAWAS